MSDDDTIYLLVRVEPYEGYYPEKAYASEETANQAVEEADGTYWDVLEVALVK